MGVASRMDQGFADHALRQLRTWPMLTVCQASSDRGTGLALRARQIVHLHDPDEAEVYLTGPVVRRMAEALNESGRVTMRPDEGWVRVRLDSLNDVSLLVSLVSVAIKANAATGGSPRRGAAPCPRSRTAAR